MNYNQFKEKIYYMPLRNMLKYSFVIIVIFAFASLMSFFDEGIVCNFCDMCGLVLSIILLMFSIHLRIISGRRIYGIIQIYFLINCVIQMIALSPDNYFEVLKIFLKNIEYGKIYNFRFINRIVVYYFLVKYRNSNNINIKVYIKYILYLIVLSALIYINSKFNVGMMKVIHFIYVSVLFILLILSWIYSKLYLIDFTKNIDLNKNIDLLKINLFFITIDCSIKLLSTNYNMYIIGNVSGLINQVVFLSSLIAIITNVTRENYNFVFKEEVDTNLYLENINKKVIRNNYKLEKTYKKLKDKQMLYKNFLGMLPDPIVIINDNLRILYCNSKFLQEFQKDNLRQVVNKRIDNYIEFNYDLTEITKDFRNSPHISTIEIKDKKVELRLFNLSDENLDYIILFKDLTEEIKLLEMKEELRNIKVRDEIKKNFLSNISHDLKIPVNVIYSAIQLDKILINNNNLEKLKVYNDISKENCFVLTKLTNNLIDISKIDSEDLEVNLIFDNIVEFLEDYLFSLNLYINSNGLETIFDTNEEEIFVYFDKEMMQRVILNLISNSVKFTEPGGLISIRVKSLEDYVLIEISDNGIGMSKEFISKAFNKYEMEDRCKINNPTGFGVGLFVVYNLINVQNGEISIESEVEKGTTFNIKMYK